MNDGVLTGKKLFNGTEVCECTCKSDDDGYLLYYGDFCEIPVPCYRPTTGGYGSYCQNGYLIGSGGNCSCECLHGYSGHNCEVADLCSDDADDFICEHKSILRGRTGNCYCECKPGYSGIYC